MQKWFWGYDSRSFSINFSSQQSPHQKRPHDLHRRKQPKRGNHHGGDSPLFAPASADGQNAQRQGRSSAQDLGYEVHDASQDDERPIAPRRAGDQAQHQYCGKNCEQDRQRGQEGVLVTRSIHEGLLTSCRWDDLPDDREAWRWAREYRPWWPCGAPRPCG